MRDYRLKISMFILVCFLPAAMSVFAQQAENKTDPLLRTEDILDWAGIVSKLSKEGEAGATETPSPSRRLWKLLSKQAQDIMLSAEQTRKLDQTEKENFISALNEILKRRDFYQYDDFSLVAAFEAKSLLHNRAKDLPASEIERLNRLLLEASYPKEIAKSKTPPGKKTLEEVLKIKSDHENSLLAIPGVTGVMVGVNNERLVIRVMVKNEAAVTLIPKNIEGVPVEVIVGDEMKPFQTCDPFQPPCPNRDILYPFPVPMGVSTFNNAWCTHTQTIRASTTGTLGFKVCESADIVGYVTATHVATDDANACPNGAPIGTIQYHRAGYDAVPPCRLESNVGALRRYQPLLPCARPAPDQPCQNVNYVDAAFIQSSNSQISNSILNIGVPSTTIRDPSTLIQGEMVRKSGRTTGVTSGPILGIGGTFSYIALGCAIGEIWYTNQVMVDNPYFAFAAFGDSGAPIVDSNTRPVAIVVAGNAYVAAGSPIGEVLNELTPLHLDCTPTGSISASPAHVCASTSGVGTTTISWNTNQFARDNVAVRESANGGTEAVFASGRSGSQDENLIASGSAYSFKLYENTGPTLLGGNFLNQVTVLGVGCGTISADPPNVLLCPGEIGTTYITWSTTIDARPFVAVRVSQDGVPSPNPFGGGASGFRQPAPWIAFGSTYVFTLYENSGSNLLTGGNPIASVTVQGVRDTTRCP